jgi:ABC-type transport system involved in cytochrome c biogenesis permease component
VDKRSQEANVLLSFLLVIPLLIPTLAQQVGIRLGILQDVGIAKETLRLDKLTNLVLLLHPTSNYIPDRMGIFEGVHSPFRQPVQGTCSIMLRPFLQS